MSRTESFLAQCPNAKVLGGSIMSIQAAMGDAAAPYFADAGLDDLQTHSWYEFEQYLHVLDAIIANEPNVMGSLVSIGMKIVETAPLPPEIDTVEKALMSMQGAWELNTQNAPTNNWHVEKVNDDKFILTNNSPFPKDMEYGVLYGFVRRFAHGRNFTVSYENLDDRVNDDQDTIRFVVQLN